MADGLSTPAADSSAAPPPVSPDTAAPASPSPGESTAPSPSATPEQGETRESLLDVVTKAVEEPRTARPKQDEPGGVSPAPTASTDPNAAPPAAASEADDLPDEVSAEELARYHPSAKRRVDKLIEQRRELRAHAQGQADHIARLEAVMPQAEAAASVQNYLRDNDIGRDDFLLTLELAAAMRRGDFRTFYEGVKPYVQLCEEYLGVSLPQDLRQRVTEGHMTTQAAAAFARERMDRALAQSRGARQTQQYEQTQTTAARNNLATAITNHVNSWETATTQSDPDFAAKKPLLKDVMRAVMAEHGPPQSPEQGVEIAKEAYRRVNEQYARWAPPRRPTSRSPSSTGRTNGAAPEPKSLTDVVSQAMEQARA